MPKARRPRKQRSARTRSRESRLKTDPLGKMSLPEDIAEIVLFLAGAGGRFMTGQLVTTRMRFG
jgi:hypothetical protein